MNGIKFEADNSCSTGIVNDSDVHWLVDGAGSRGMSKMKKATQESKMAPRVDDDSTTQGKVHIGTG